MGTRDEKGEAGGDAGLLAPVRRQTSADDAGDLFGRFNCHQQGGGGSRGSIVA